MIILKNHLTLYWAKEGAAYSVMDDIRFVTGRYRGGGPWITRRKCYALALRYGFAFRLRLEGDWHFVGYLRLEHLGETNEADTPGTTSDIEPRQPAQQNAACEDEQAKSSDAYHLDPQRTKTDAFCNQGCEESRKLLAVTIAKNRTAAPGTPPDATAPLSDRSPPSQEEEADEALSGSSTSNFHESAKISKSCHEKSSASKSGGAGPAGGDHG